MGLGSPGGWGGHRESRCSPGLWAEEARIDSVGKREEPEVRVWARQGAVDSLPHLLNTKAKGRARPLACVPCGRPRQTSLPNLYS